MRITSRGFSMVEAMVSGVLVIGLGAVVVGISDNQKKSEIGLKDKSDLTRAMNRIGEQVSDPNTCRLNFLNKNIGEPLRISELKDKNGDSIVKEGEIFENKSNSGNDQESIGRSNKTSQQIESFETGNYAAKEIFIRNYDSQKDRVQLRILFDRSGVGVASKSINKFFNFYARVEGNVIKECLDPIEQAAFGSMMKSCYDVDPKLHGICEENFKKLLGEVKQLYCTGHPILEYDSASEKCRALDGNKVCGGGYIQGFSDTGSFICYPGPSRPVPPPDRVSLPCLAWTAWAPSAATVCSGVPLTQNRSCPLSGAAESQVIVGSKTDGACTPPPPPTCSASWTAWVPNSDSVCPSLSVYQSRGRICPSGPQSENQTVTGTKTDPSCDPSVPCTGSWAPHPDTVCLGTPFTQTRTCPNGSEQTQIVSGADGSASCCKSWGSWSPDSDSVCCENTVTQTRTCLDAGSSATETKSVAGTKMNGTCGGAWSPTLADSCSTTKVTQTNSCGITREVDGEKTCGCIFFRPYSWSGASTRDGDVSCVEYFKPVGSTYEDTIIIPEGETYNMSSGYCVSTKTGGCYGEARVTCVNGLHVYGLSFCSPGLIP